MGEADMGRMLFGLETEYALAAVDRAGEPVDRFPILERMLQVARREHATLRDGSAHGLFLANGGRFYIDAPDHPEFATPEVTNPSDAVRYLRAGDRFVSKLAAAAVAETEEAAKVFVLRCNVDYSGAGTTWGQHESYLHRCDPAILPQELIPHLVSRIIYTGAGGFENLRPHGAHFTLSPRTWHLHHAVSEQSQCQRSIFHTKQEPLSGGGYHRLHVIAGESLASDTAAWLKVGTTALIVAMIDGGVRPGSAIRLRSPVTAMRTFASDVTCKAKAAALRGRSLRAIDIQRHYLQLAEKHIGAEFMPMWTPHVCERWRAVLDLLESAPDSVSSILDWAIKLAVYQRHAERAGVGWAALGHWNDILVRLGSSGLLSGARRRNRLVQQVPLSVDAVLNPRSPLRDEVERLTPRLERYGLRWEGLKAFSELRQQLFELDARFAQLGEESVFASLDRAGVLKHEICGVKDIDDAIDDPPSTGRAKARGQFVRELARQEASEILCDWSGIWDRRTHLRVAMEDPFAADVRWGPWTDEGPAFWRWVSDNDSIFGDRRQQARETQREGIAGMLEGRGRYEEALSLRIEGLTDAERRYGRDHPETALACNNLAVLFRCLCRPDEAEPHARRALEIDMAARAADDPKIPHRLNNLALILVMLGRLNEARRHLEHAWRLKDGRYDITSARILWTRLATAMVGAEPSIAQLIGRMKSVLALEELPTDGGVLSQWDPSSVVTFIRPELSTWEALLLRRLGQALNDRRRLRILNQFACWRDQPPLPLDTAAESEDEDEDQMALSL